MQGFLGFPRDPYGPVDLSLGFKWCREVHGDSDLGINLDSTSRPADKACLRAIFRRDTYFNIFEALCCTSSHPPDELHNTAHDQAGWIGTTLVTSLFEPINIFFCFFSTTYITMLNAPLGPVTINAPHGPVTIWLIPEH